MVAAALYSWPFVTLALFAALGPARGLIWATILGYLFLPEMTIRSLPVLPDYGKTTAISYSLLLAVLVFRSRMPKGSPPMTALGRAIIAICILGIFGGALMTVLDNGAALRDAGRVRQGLSVRDTGNLITSTLIDLVPFALALRYLHTRELQRELLLALAAAGAVYAALVLYEWRMSPQFNRIVYDFFPHSWRQHLRGDGFRPVVFLRHGLWVGFFLLSAVLAAVTLWRTVPADKKVIPIVTVAWLMIVLFLSSNLGATILAVTFFPVAFLMTRRLQVRIAMLCALLFLAYPALRQADLVPADRMVSAFATYSERRAASLGYRFENEKMILDRVMEKPVFGWGSWGRWRIIDEKGRDITTSDGIWIIVLGKLGWVGYLSYFGLLASSLLFLPGGARRDEIPLETAGLATITGVNLIYMIPNSTLSPIGFLVAGAVAARAFRNTVQEDTASATEAKGATQRQASYTRFELPGAGDAPERKVLPTTRFRTPEEDTA